MEGGWGVRREAARPISFCMYNIWNRGNGLLDSALQVMDRDNLDLRVFQETKVTNGIYTRTLTGCGVFATDTLAVFYRDAPHFQVEALHQHVRMCLFFRRCHWDGAG